MSKNFNAINRKANRPAAAVKWLAENGMADAPETNSLNVVAQADKTIINIDGSIGKSWWDDSGVSAKEVNEAINAALENEKPIQINVNSIGGSVGDGLAIYDAIGQNADKITARITGYALSIASIFPLAAGKVVSPDSAIWMTHEAWMDSSGNKRDKLRDAAMLEKHDKNLSNIYAKRTGKSASYWAAKMESETWFTGDEAVAEGLAESDSADISAENLHPVFAGYLSRCKNIPAEILNVLRSPQTVPAAPQNGAADNPAAVAAENQTAAVTAATPPQPKIVMPEKNDPAAVAPTAPDALAEIKALKTQLITTRVIDYVKSQKITKAEIPLFVAAAISDEAGTFAILDAKQPTNDAPAPISGSVFEVGKPAEPTGAKARYVALQGKTASVRYAALKLDWDTMIQDAFKQDEIRNAPLLRQGIMPQNSNTYSSTLITSFLTDGSTTVLQNKWSPLRAFSRDFSTDPYKPNAVAQHKYVSAGPTVQTDATSFESGDATVAPITITPHQYTAAINVSNADLNNGLRMENLATVLSAALANKVIEAATAPMTLANFAAVTTATTGQVITAANFTFTDMSRIWGVLAKANQRFAILDPAYYAKLMLQPTYFKDVANGKDEGALTPYGWDGIFINSDWTGASNNIAAFFCDPQAIAALMGLPLTPPSGIPGNTLQTGTFKIPGVEASVQTNSWFNLAARTAWMSLDVIAGFSKMDGTAGACVVTS